MIKEQETQCPAKPYINKQKKMFQTYLRRYIYVYKLVGQMAGPNWWTFLRETMGNLAKRIGNFCFSNSTSNIS